MSWWDNSAFLIGLAAVFGGTVKLFWNADQAFSEEFRKALSDKLLSVRVDHSDAAFLSFFSHLASSVFGARYVSLRAIAVSSVISITSVFVVWSLDLYVDGRTYEDVFIKADEDERLRQHPVMVWSVLAGIMMMNCIPDFLALIKTRWIVDKLRRYQSAYWVVLAIAVDVLLVLPLFLSVVFIGTFALMFSALLMAGFPVGISDIPKLWDIVIDGFTKSGGAVILLIAAFFSAAWLYVTAIAWCGLRVSTQLHRTTAFLQFALPMKNYPVRSVGLVTAFLAGILYVIGSVALR
jgi:hypothetical protein